MRPRFSSYPTAPGNFNPRTPCGVRLYTHLSHERENIISIHAPLAGCDHDHAPIPAASRSISIHAPLAGCDRLQRLLCADIRISIHAPLAGCDSAPPRRPTRTAYFNPRTPCGVRQKWISVKERMPSFQSTHPLRGATPGRGRAVRLPGYFNPRTPCGVRRRPPGQGWRG